MEHPVGVEDWRNLHESQPVGVKDTRQAVFVGP